MDVRKVEGPGRAFGAAPTATWTAFRAVVPWQENPDSRPDLPYSAVAYDFLKTTPATRFYAAGPAMPATDGQFMGAEKR
jgi:hypothetical protein